MRVIFGLGNPGKEYEETRHNVGFRVVDSLSQKYKVKLDSYLCQCWMGEGRIDEERILLAKPLTFVNAAGGSLSQIKQKYGIKLEDIILISDDADLDLGKLRIARRGGDGGHKGLGSIIESLKTEEIPRLKIGIGRPDKELELEEYVLGRFSSEERRIIEEAVDKATEAIEVMIKRGIDKVMREYN